MAARTNAPAVLNARASVICAACVGLGAAATARADVQFVPRLGVAAVYTDNFLLAGPGEPKVDEFLAVATPGFRFVQSSQRLQSFADYTLQLLDSERGGTKVFHNGMFGVKADAIDRWLNVQLNGRRGQYTFDPTDPRNIDNLFLVEDTIDVTSASVAPELLHDFKTLRLDVKYSVGLVDYSGPNVAGNIFLENSKNQDGSFYLGAIDQAAPLSWDVRYRHDRVDYTEAEPFDSDRVDLDLGIRVSGMLRLLLRAGAESDPRTQAQTGGFGDALWQGGFLYRRDANNDFQFLVGHRFFGPSYDASWHHRARLVVFDVEYNEDPTTEAEQLILRGASSQPVISEPGVDQTFGQFTNAVYLLKQLSANATVTGRLTSIRLSLESLQRDYILSGGADNVRTAAVIASRRFGPTLSAELRAEYDRVALDGGFRFNDQLLSLRLARQIGRDTSVYVSANHMNRTGNTLEIYDVNWVMLGFDVALGKIRDPLQHPSEHFPAQ
jgi:uncharacterized protein (PEP-CTERM system associated)